MTSEFELAAGLEVHCQLSTKSKLFCGCPAQAEAAEPNAHICPVCTGQPGALPVLNEAAVELAIRAGLALGCRIAPASIFARKNYFYPDLPKAYQISQYEAPFALGGTLELEAGQGGAPRTIRLRRVHLEEDAGKLLHAIGSRALDCTLVDFNRCGAPLIEIVTEPDLASGEDAYAFLVALKEILMYAGISKCDMEKGELRCDVNVSVRPKGGKELGTKVEVKNLNSFKAVREAIQFEARRQAEAIGQGGKVVHQTRLWDAAARLSRAMREKEEAQDYRYFPDPDLPPLNADPRWIEGLRASLPELPAARRRRFSRDYGVSGYDAGVLCAERALADWFEAAAKGVSAAAMKTLVSLVTTELLGRLNAARLDLAQCPVSPAALARLAALVQEGTLSTKLAREVLDKAWTTRKGPDDLVAELGLAQVSDEGRVKDWVRAALDANPKAAQDLRAGKLQAAGAIVGAVMRLSRGKANPALVQRLIKEEVKG